MSGTLCFGHHPEPAIDFCVEVECIESMAADYSLTGRCFNDDDTPATRDGLDRRVERALGFRVGGDAGAVEAKQRLRETAIRLKGGEPLRVTLPNGAPGVLAQGPAS